MDLDFYLSLIYSAFLYVTIKKIQQPEEKT